MAILEECLGIHEEVSTATFRRVGSRAPQRNTITDRAHSTIKVATATRVINAIAVADIKAASAAIECGLRCPVIFLRDGWHHFGRNPRFPGLALHYNVTRFNLVGEH